MASVASVNLGRARPVRSAGRRPTAIDKRPVGGPVQVSEPGPRGVGGSGLDGDDICDRRHHGGTDQAVYAYASEDYRFWTEELGRTFAPGNFGENLTTVDLPVTDAVVGETWSVGDDLVLEVAVPRIPCRVFAGWLAEQGWVRRFTRAGRPGAYLRVLHPGPVRAGDAIRVLDRPAHGITIGLTFAVLTTRPDLLPRLLDAPQLPAAVLDTARARTGT